MFWSMSTILSSFLCSLNGRHGTGEKTRGLKGVWCSCREFKVSSQHSLQAAYRTCNSRSREYNALFWPFQVQQSYPHLCRYFKNIKNKSFKKWLTRMPLSPFIQATLFHNVLPPQSFAQWIVCREHIFSLPVCVCWEVTAVWIHSHCIVTNAYQLVL